MEKDALSVLARSAVEFSILCIVIAAIVTVIVLAIMEAFGRFYLNYTVSRKLLYSELFGTAKRRIETSAFRLPYRQLCNQILSLQFNEIEARSDKSEALSSKSDMIEERMLRSIAERKIDELQSRLGTATTLTHYALSAFVSAFVVWMISRNLRSADSFFANQSANAGFATEILFGVTIISALISPLLVPILERKFLQR